MTWSGASTCARWSSGRRRLRLPFFCVLIIRTIPKNGLEMIYSPHNPMVDSGQGPRGDDWREGGEGVTGGDALRGKKITTEMMSFQRRTFWP